MERIVYPLDGPGGPLEGIDMSSLPDPVRQQYFANPYDAKMLEGLHAIERERSQAHLATLTTEQLAARDKKIQAYLSNVAGVPGPSSVE